MHDLPPPLDLLPLLSTGLWITLQITAGGTLVAVLAAFAAGVAQLSPHRWLRIPALIYIDLFRGTSALVQLFWVYFALPAFGIRLEAMTAAILVLGLNIGAYGAEVVRGALVAVPRSQHDAALALNFSASERLRYVIFPQAVALMLPPFGNLLIELLKSTALVSLITLGDLTFQAQVLRSATLRSAEIFTLVLLLYFLVAQLLGQGMRQLERRYRAHLTPEST
ncbi:MAG TPA: ectoine/hydroxyectoine ABC transporter permease subunit EhuC [Gammaproteobacteria bacterium]|nr:ectoine/hydroxyectoine ABC transporter permease subunit EhuC [Gammaproteobacteria bacterium]MCH77521.1 ectoine/hydroxyectoine ABC transporter permease subunit EhuC [Gammaproteobacteria bacterium]